MTTPPGATTFDRLLSAFGSGLFTVEQLNALAGEIDFATSSAQLISSLGYTPLNKAGDTISGLLTASLGITVTGGAALAASFTNFGRGNTYALSGSAIDTTKMGLFVNNNVSGVSTAAEIPAAGYFSIASANVNAPGTLIDGVSIAMNAGGAVAASAGWNALAVSLNDSAATNDLAGGGAGAFVAAQINRRSSKNQGGAGLTPSTAFGQHWGIDIVNVLQSGATFQALQNGIEINQSIQTGASAIRRAGLQISSPATHVNRAALWDNAIVVGLASSAATHRAGIMFGQPISGTSPLGSDSVMLAHKLALDRTAAAGIGIDCNDVTYTTDFLRAPGIGIDPSGVLRIGTLYATATTAGAELDAKGSIGTGTPTVNTGGSLFSTTDIADDGFGGVYQLTAPSGAVTAVTVLRQPMYPTTSPPATLTLTARAPSTGTGCVLNASWATNRTGISINPTGQKIGFNGTAPVAKPTVTGSKGANAALTSLMTALAGYGLVIDSTT